MGEMIEEKEKLNRIDSEANSSLNRSMEAEVKREAVVSPAKEVVEVATKVVDEVPIKDQDDSSKTSTEAASPKEEISEEANIENWKDGKMEVNDDVLEAAKEETEDVIDTIEELQEALEEKKNIEEVQDILEEKDNGENVISGGGEEGQTSDEEERDEEKESIEGEQQGGALGLRRELQSDDDDEEEGGN